VSKRKKRRPETKRLPYSLGGVLVGKSPTLDEKPAVRTDAPPRAGTAPAVIKTAGKEAAPASQVHLEARGTAAAAAGRANFHILGGPGAVVYQTAAPPLPSLAIVPTPYPDDPAAELPIQDYVRVDLASATVQAFNAKLDEILDELQRSNTITGEIRDRLSAELRAGRILLDAPKPNRTLVDLLLVTPLKYLASQAGPAIIGALASEALRLLLEMLSQQPHIPL
jgi:hypothetical protein